MIDSEKLLEDLTDAQRQAVTHVDGPLLIVAAAGSGKTRVITRRVAYLLSLGIPAGAVLAITFTNKAAGEMKDRVGKVLGKPVRDFGRLDQPWPMICTFHSLCLRVLRQYGERVGLPNNFSIFDAADQTKLVKEALKALDISTTNFSPGTVHGAISNAKNKLLTAAEFAQGAGDFFSRTVARVYTKYQQLLDQNNALDFDDLLLRTVLAFRDHPQVLKDLQERFQYLMIDEYQDTNRAQYLLANALAQNHRNIAVVGDPDQCVPPGTMIGTPEGPRAVETLKAGAEVMSATGWGKVGTMAVDNVVQRRYAGPLVKIRTQDGFELRATPNHVGFAKPALRGEGEAPAEPRSAALSRFRLRNRKRRDRPSGCSNTTVVGEPLTAARREPRPPGSRRLTPCETRFSVFGGRRPAAGVIWHSHTVRFVADGSTAADGVARLCRADYADGLALARQTVALRDDVDVVPEIRLTPRDAFRFVRVRDIHPGMLVPVYTDGQVVESIVESAEWEDYDGPVYDLSVPNTRNYVANGMVVHNSIYAWRGADIQNILDFENDYPDAKVVRLEQNYRSTKRILAVAGGLIEHNTQRKEKALWTENSEGERVKLVLCQDERDEAGVVAEQLKELHDKKGIAWGEMAVFYRINALSRVMEDALRKAGMPYQIARGVEFYNRREIKDVLAYLRVVANPRDEVSLDRIANVPARGLGDAAVKQVSAYAVGNGIALFEAMTRADSVPGLSPRAAAAATGFVQLVGRWRRLAGVVGAAAAAAPPVELEISGLQSQVSEDGRGRVQAVMEDVVRASGYEAHLRKLDKEKEEGERPSDNVNELITSAAEYDREHPEGSLTEYLAQISLVSDADHMEGAGGAITLMTLHAAKGLEFPVVAMIGLEEGVLPHSRARGNLKELEEERRLCFVGITRARQRLILSKAAYRTVRGLRDRTVTSPFLNELPGEHLETFDRTSAEGLGGWSERAEQREAAREEARGLAGQFRRGQMVRHPKFGIGKILDVTDIGQQTRAVVDFRQGGQKTLILQYARLEPVG